MADPLAAVGTSLRFAVLATVIAVVVGGSAAVAIAASRRGGSLLDAGLMLPLGTSAVTVGFGLLITMDRRPLDLGARGSSSPSPTRVVAVPFVVRAVLPTLRSIDPRLRDAASTLGASPARVWREIDLPFLRRALVAGAGFAFAISLGEFGATSFLTRVGNETMPIAIARLLGRPEPGQPGPGVRAGHRADGADPRRDPRRRSPAGRRGGLLGRRGVRCSRSTG